jgi:hypothetical protein
LRVDGKDLVEILYEKPAVLKGELDVSTFKIISVGLSQDRE